MINNKKLYVVLNSQTVKKKTKKIEFPSLYLKSNVQSSNLSIDLPPPLEAPLDLEA